MSQTIISAMFLDAYQLSDPQKSPCFWVKLSLHFPTFLPVTLWKFKIGTENHNLLWANPSTHGPFSVAMFNFRRVGHHHQRHRPTVLRRLRFGPRFEMK